MLDDRAKGASGAPESGLVSSTRALGEETEIAGPQTTADVTVCLFSFSAVTVSHWLSVGHGTTCAFSPSHTVESFQRGGCLCVCVCMCVCVSVCTLLEERRRLVIPRIENLWSVQPPR